MLRAVDLAGDQGRRHSVQAQPAGGKRLATPSLLRTDPVPGAGVAKPIARSMLPKLKYTSHMTGRVVTAPLPINHAPAYDDATFAAQAAAHLAAREAAAAETAAAAATLKRLAQSNYVNSRRASLEYYQNGGPGIGASTFAGGGTGGGGAGAGGGAAGGGPVAVHHLADRDDSFCVRPDSAAQAASALVAEARSDTLVVTIITGTHLADAVSDAARTHGRVLTTMCVGEEVRLRVSVAALQYPLLLAEVEECTGMDFAIRREGLDRPGYECPSPVTTPVAARGSKDALRLPVLTRAAAPARVLAPAIAPVPSTDPAPAPESKARGHARAHAPTDADDSVTRFLLRQCKEITRAKANAALLDAAVTGATFRLTRLLDKGLSIPALDPVSLTISELNLEDADDPDAVHVTADAEALNDKGETPMMIAAYYGHATFVLRLLEFGASINHHNWAGETAFECAQRGLIAAKVARTRKIEGARAWASGCSATLRALDRRNIIACAAHRDLHRIQYLVDELGQDPNETNSNGMTALHYAVNTCAPQVVKFLLSRGADPHAMNTIGQSPMSLSLEKSHTSLISVMFLEHEKAQRRRY